MTARLATVTVTNNVKSKAPRKAPRKASTKPLRRAEKVQVGVFFGLALCGLCVSLPHIASEVGQLTGSGLFASWLVALVIDAGMVACKAYITDGACGLNRLVAWVTLATCTLVSCILNCHAFLAHSSDTFFGSFMSVFFGGFIPLFVVGLSFMGSAILLGHKK